MTTTGKEVMMDGPGTDKIVYLKRIVSPGGGRGAGRGTGRIMTMFATRKYDVRVGGFGLRR